jgi:hypothetical protein
MEGASAHRCQLQEMERQTAVDRHHLAIVSEFFYHAPPSGPRWTFEIVSIRLLAVHGLSVEFSVDKRLFGDVADEFLAFVGDAPLVAHNAGFDIAFLNAELKRTAKLPIGTERVIDTLVLARRKHSGGPPRVSTVPGRPASGRHAPGAPSGGVTRVRGVASFLGIMGSFRPRNWVNFSCCGAPI